MQENVLEIKDFEFFYIKNNLGKYIKEDIRHIYNYDVNQAYKYFKYLQAFKRLPVCGINSYVVGVIKGKQYKIENILDYIKITEEDINKISLAENQVKNQTTRLNYKYPVYNKQEQVIGEIELIGNRESTYSYKITLNNQKDLLDLKTNKFILNLL